ncbi:MULTISPECIES: hypothetical protein [unclassified Pseudovibrio]|uniref:hypothetical protein n=1 Tax=unclassified Pseudovibrio TaxID=2627060 RepID=UPI0007B23582|nr:MULTISPECIES: hypothetical protein [unclassified Pseudovibrio]KZL24419.1 hypothetical protein PsAD37_02667 [Pseudovibrio sp. Ad37]KZL27448.1 hypothetical protein PsWM33_00957 [Pseudovibrio sp. WM33]
MKDHSYNHMELYGETGTLYGPDPNFFGGEVSVTDESGTSVELPARQHPFGEPNQQNDSMGAMANYRAAGLSDMAMGILEDRPHRCNQALALHVADIMFSILASGRERRFVELATTCNRPYAFLKEDAEQMLLSS